MKKIFLVGLSAVAVGLAVTACNNTDKKTNNASAQTEEHDHAGHNHAEHDHPIMAATPPAQTLPNFEFYRFRSGIKVTRDDLSKDKNSVFLFFDPGCGHCQQEAEALEKNMDRLKNVDLYFVSMNDPALILGFEKSFMPKLSEAKNVEILFDKGQEFITKIHVPNQFPANYVYGPNGQLKSSWEGDRNINEIITEFTK